jgi:DNA repair exonuclease SbcCD ATPase subunit
MLTKWKSELDLFDSKDIDIETPQKELLEVDSSIKNSALKFKTMIDQLDQQKKTKLSELQAIASLNKVEVAKITSEDLESMNENKNNLVKESNDSSTNFRQQLHKVETEESNATHDIDILTENLLELESNVMDTENSICPTCEQEVTDIAKEKLIAKVGSYKRTLNSLINKKKECDTELKKIGGTYKQEAEKYNRMIAIVDREIRRCKEEESEEYEKTEYRFKVAKEKVSELVDTEEKKIIAKSNDQTQDLQKTKFQLTLEISRKEELRKELRKIELNVSNFEGAIISCDDQIRHQESLEYDETQLNSYYKKDIELSREISDIQKSMISIDRNMDVLKFWKIGFSSAGIPSMLIDEAIPYMNERVDYYLDMLTNSRYVVSFDTLSEIKSKEFRDKISVHVLDTQTRADSRVQLSGGQTRIIDIAIILTLGDLLSRIQNVSFNILLFDEIFDALDEQNVQYVSRVLSKIKFGKSVYVISHQHQNHLEADEILAFA